MSKVEGNAGETRSNTAARRSAITSYILVPVPSPLSRQLCITAVLYTLEYEAMESGVALTGKRYLIAPEPSPRAGCHIDTIASGSEPER